MARKAKARVDKRIDLKAWNQTRIDRLRSILAEYTDKNTFRGSEMRAIRQSYGLTLKQFAEVVDSGNYVNMSNMENGKTGVSPRMQIALRNLLAMKAKGEPIQ